MKAMVLAAGLGTRLRPLTNDRPKALVEVGGRTLLEITLSRLRACGVSEVIVNLHHFTDLILEYLADNDNFGMHIAISREETLLDTGGGLKKASHFFLENLSHLEEPFLLHNVDVISTIDIQQMVQFHKERGALATLAVRHRESSRALLFDEHLALCGRVAGSNSRLDIVPSSVATHALAFSGIHVISPRIFDQMTEQGSFSIITAYLRLAAGQETIVGFVDDAAYWCDLGRPENVKRAAEEFALWH